MPASSCHRSWSCRVRKAGHLMVIRGTNIGSTDSHWVTAWILSMTIRPDY
jgi:hypothetical protein